MNPRIVMVGSGGHAKQLKRVLDENNANVDLLVSPFAETETWSNINRISTDEEAINNLNPDDRIIIGVGFVIGKNARASLIKKYSKKFNFYSVISKKAIIDKSCNIKEGVQILPNVTINNNVYIGKNTIINTGAIIEHDVNIGANCHIAPGAIVCGNVNIGDNCFIGAGSVIVNNQTVESCSTIKAGVLFNG